MEAINLIDGIEIQGQSLFHHKKKSQWSWINHSHHWVIDSYFNPCSIPLSVLREVSRVPSRKSIRNKMLFRSGGHGKPSLMWKSRLPKIKMQFCDLWKPLFCNWSKGDTGSYVSTPFLFPLGYEILKRKKHVSLPSRKRGRKK